MTHPLAALIAGVKVKSLKWFEAELPSRGGGKYTADGYTIRRIEGLWLLDFAGNGKSAWRWVDLEAAKAAAQADYEARILAALEAAHHVNETPKSEHDGDNVLTVPDLVEAAKEHTTLLRLSPWSDGYPRLYELPDLIEALIALATAQAAQIAGVSADNARVRAICERMQRRADAAEARADAAEAETQKVRRFLKISRDEGREALERAEAAETALHGAIQSLADADYDNIIAHLSYELEPTGTLPNRNSAFMALVHARNEIVALEADKTKALDLVAETITRAVNAEAKVAELEAQIVGLTKERDDWRKLESAAKGLSEVLDQHETKGPLPDTALMFCWLAAQNVRAVLRGYMLEKTE